MKKLLTVLMILVFQIVGTFNAYAGNYFAFLYIDDMAHYDNIYVPYKLQYEDIVANGEKVQAKAAAAWLKTMPQGKKCIDLTMLTRIITQDAETRIFWDAGAKKLKKVVDVFFAELKKLGVEVDYIIDDNEMGMSNWTLTDSKIVKEIEENTRYIEEVKPLLQKYGFEFGNENQGDLYYVVNWSKHEDAYTVWNAVMEERISKYYNESVFYVIKQYYPDIKLSNYQSVCTDKSTNVAEGNGHKAFHTGNSSFIGTHSSPVCYARIGQLSLQGRQPTGYPYSNFLVTGYNCLLMEVIQCQDAVRCTPGGRIMPWIGLKSWNSEANYRNFLGTSYYEEFIFHLGMYNPDPVLIFNHGGGNVNEDTKHISELLEELDRVVGTGKKNAVLKDITPWSSKYVLSGIETEDKTVWRLTPDLYTKGVTIENFLYDKGNLVFKIGNQTIDFPDDSYIERCDYSDYGYWIISPKGTKPVEYSDDTLTDGGMPVETSDYIPTGYMYESEVTKKEVAAGKEDKRPEDSDEKSAEVIDVKLHDIKGHWAEEVLNVMISKGIIKGSDIGIEPNRTINKAEFVSLLIRTMGIDKVDFADEIGDVSVLNWYADDIKTALSLGWIELDNSMAYPVKPLTRGEATVILARAIGSGNVTFASFRDDYLMDETTKNAAHGLSAIGIINGYPDGEFKPHNVITRAETATILYKALIK